MSETDWFKKAIVYQIMIDRFAGYTSKDWKKPNFLGGNLRGIIEKLPYLKDLGVNTLWISPFYESDNYHGYSITDFFKVNPHFGTEEDLKELIDTVHANGMRIIADFVPNHCSDKHPYFVEAQDNETSPYHHWFYFKKWPDDYLSFLDFKNLPKLNLGYEPAREYIMRSAKKWLELGLDGYRLDHVAGPKHKFWRYFYNEMKKEFPHAVLIGEAWFATIKLKHLKTMHIKKKYWKWLWGDVSDTMLKSYKGEMDGVLDFKFQRLMENHIAKKPKWIPNWLLDWALKRHFKKYPPGYFLPTFLDNHDMDRFLFTCGNDKEKLKKAAEIQFEIDQPPIIYYGTEVGMSQDIGMAGRPHGDLRARKTMRWDKETQSKELLDFYKKLIAKRKKAGLSL